MTFVRLRPLFVLTGTLHIEGGWSSTRTETDAVSRARATETTIVQKRAVSKDRERAHVIFSTYARNVKALRLLKTPFGMLFAPEQVSAVQALIVEMTKKASDFNKTARDCRIENCLVLEPLDGSRKAALEGWLARRRRENDAQVLAALPNLTA